MHLNTLFKSTFFLGLAALVKCGDKRLTFYDDGLVPACGRDYQESSYYVAINLDQFSESKCGKCVKISFEGKSVVGKLVDSCESCPYGSLDVSPKMFSKLADLSKGVIYVDWEYTDCGDLGSSGSSEKKTTSSKKSTTSSTIKTTSTTSKAKLTTTTTTTVAKTVITTKAVTLNTVATKNATATKIAAAGTKISAATGAPNANANANANAKTNASANANQNVVVDAVDNNESNSTTYALPITGAVVGAAGIGLLCYSKRQSIKEKLPEKLGNIKRSITHVRKNRQVRTNENDNVNVPIQINSGDNY